MIATPSNRWTMLAAACVLFAGGCSDATGPVGREVLVDANPGSLRITNTLAEPVYTLVIGRDYAALAQWAACVEDSGCGRIEAGGTIDVPDPNLSMPPGNPVNEEALVYWWTAVRGAGGARVAGPIHQVIVPLQPAPNDA